MPTCGLEASVAGGDLRFRLRVVLAAAPVEVTGVSSGGGPEVGNEFSAKDREKTRLDARGRKNRIHDLRLWS